MGLPEAAVLSKWVLKVRQNSNGGWRSAVRPQVGRVVTKKKGTEDGVKKKNQRFKVALN